MKVMNIIAGLSFAAAVGLVGTIEHGGSLLLIIPALACVAVFGLCTSAR